MLWVLTTRAFTHTVDRLRVYIGGEFRRRVRCLPYESLRRRRALPAGAYLFTDHERLSLRDFQRAARVAAHVRRTTPDALLLNDPRAVSRRVELLRSLHADGTNSYNVYRADMRRLPERWPVFLRGEQDHAGPATELLHGPEELESALREERARGLDRSRRMIVEYAETKSADGFYRKYGAFRVRDRIIPRHLFLSRGFAVKQEEPPDAAAHAEACAYVASGPHNAQLMSIFERAGIEYGRIDYACVADRIEVWEINTNPAVVDAPTLEIGERFPASLEVIPRIADALLELARAGRNAKRISLSGVRGVRPRWWRPV